MNKFCRKVFLLLMMIISMSSLMSFITYANSLDDLSNGNTTDNSQQYQQSQQTTINDSVMSDYLKGYSPVDDDAMQRASVFASPIVNLIGTLIGGIMMLLSAGIFLQTALDLTYISIPFMRSMLAPQASATGGAPMGGMGMGMGMGMHGMGMGGMQNQQASPIGLKVTEDAINAVQAASAQQNTQSPMGGNMAMGMQQQQQQVQKPKPAIVTYFYKRAVFLIFFAICATILMSSIFTDCGLNLAALIEKIMIKVNGSVNEIEIN